MYRGSGDQNNFFKATQGVDALVSAFEAAVSSVDFDGDSDDFYVWASAYNMLVEKYNRLAHHARWLQREHGRLVNENARLLRLLNVGRK